MSSSIFVEEDNSKRAEVIKKEFDELSGVLEKFTQKFDPKSKVKFSSYKKYPYTPNTYDYKFLVNKRKPGEKKVYKLAVYRSMQLLEDRAILVNELMSTNIGDFGGKGLADVINLKGLAGLYKAGYSNKNISIRLDANLEAGAYLWLKKGFIPDDIEQLKFY